MTLRFTPSDPRLEAEGIWKDYYQVKVKIRRATQPDFVKAIRESRNGADEIPDERYAELCAKYLLIDWDEDLVGEPYSVETATQVLKEDRDFGVFVGRIAADPMEYRGEPVAGK